MLENINKYIKTCTAPVFYCDIETYKYNMANSIYAEKFKPSEGKVGIYSFAFGFVLDEKRYIYHVAHFTDFYNLFLKNYYKRNIRLFFHNGMSYDTHMLRREMIDYLNYKPVNAYDLASIDHERQTKIEKGERFIFESRIKSNSKLEFTYFINDLKFITRDSLPLTRLPLKILGEKLLRIGVLNENDLKTDYNYTSYDKMENMNAQEAYAYAARVHEKLSKEEVIYIKNDIKILLETLENYDKLYPEFDKNLRTMTQSVLKGYRTSALSDFQLLAVIGKNKKKQDVKLEFDKYKIADENLLFWLKHFYKGGLNFYNDLKIGKIIESQLFSIDRNSSYPHVMATMNYPLLPEKYIKNGFIYELEKNKNSFIFFELKKNDFNRFLETIKSRILSQLLVKYLNSFKSEMIYITTPILELLKSINPIVTSFHFKNALVFSTRKFAGREEIKKYYTQKSEAKTGQKLKFNEDMSDYEILDEKSDKLSESEILVIKEKLNSLYGLTALRPYFDKSEIGEDGDYQIYHNFHKNSIRNITFAITTTAYAFSELVKPLLLLDYNEIDEYFYYADTDSLYLDKSVYSKIVEGVNIDPIALGSWDVEHGDIKRFFILNHKKYAYETRKSIIVRSGGVPRDAFDLSQNFNDFIINEFSHGKKVKSLHNLLTKEMTMVLYEADTLLQGGTSYPTKYMNDISSIQDKALSEFIETNKEHADGMYIEGVFGGVSLQTIEMDKRLETESALPIKALIEKCREIKKLF
jgi:hypothetical protein